MDEAWACLKASEKARPTTREPMMTTWVMRRCAWEGCGLAGDERLTVGEGRVFSPYHDGGEGGGTRRGKRCRRARVVSKVGVSSRLGNSGVDDFTIPSVGGKGRAGKSEDRKFLVGWGKSAAPGGGDGVGTYGWCYGRSTRLLC